MSIVRMLSEVLADGPGCAIAGGPTTGCVGVTVTAGAAAGAASGGATGGCSTCGGAAASLEAPALWWMVAWAAVVFEVLFMG
jgi:hypothetical protein